MSNDIYELDINELDAVTGGTGGVQTVAASIASETPIIKFENPVWDYSQNRAK